MTTYNIQLVVHYLHYANRTSMVLQCNICIQVSQYRSTEIPQQTLHDDSKLIAVCFLRQFGHVLSIPIVLLSHLQAMLRCTMYDNLYRYRSTKIPIVILSIRVVKQSRYMQICTYVYRTNRQFVLTSICSYAIGNLQNVFLRC